ncbi:unnamed protein product [marine sediment metagenome]|uniref:Uncharacterized protein n=1 Tax=marine sediment metagenome TaxID=412755 RepID=X0XYU0_9ZZZZ
MLDLPAQGVPDKGCLAGGLGVVVLLGVAAAGGYALGPVVPVADGGGVPSIMRWEVNRYFRCRR